MLSESQKFHVYDDPWYGFHRVARPERISLPPGTLFFIEDDMMSFYPSRLINEGELLLWLGDGVFLSKTGVLRLYEESFICFFTDASGTPI